MSKAVGETTSYEEGKIALDGKCASKAAPKPKNHKKACKAGILLGLIGGGMLIFVVALLTTQASGPTVGLSKKTPNPILRSGYQSLLKHKRFIMAHDAATGYIGADWIALKTQSGSFTQQLECGARALDLRVGYQTKADQANKGPLRFHHNKLIKEQSVQQQIPEVLKWADDNPSELVILYVSHCKTGDFDEIEIWKYSGGPCNDPKDDDAFLAPFRNLNISVLTDKDKELLKTMTVNDAEKLARRPGANRGNGMVLVITEMADNYIEVNGKGVPQWNVVPGFCGGTGVSANTKPDSFNGPNGLWTYVRQIFDTYTDDYAEANGLWQLQGIWQGGAGNLDIVGIVKERIVIHPANSCGSGINGLIFQKIDAGNAGDNDERNWNKLNFLLLNAVQCHGPQIYNAFNGKYPAGTCMPC